MDDIANEVKEYVDSALRNLNQIRDALGITPELCEKSRLIEENNGLRYQNGELARERRGLVIRIDQLRKEIGHLIQERDDARAERDASKHKRLSDKSEMIFIEMLGEGEWSSEDVCAAIREALSILSPDLFERI